MDIYEKLGVRKIINATGFSTDLGGAIMAREVLEAMTQASRSNVNMRELHEKAGKRVAELLDVEAACITSCAAAGLCIAIAACITGKDMDKIKKLPEINGDKKEVIIQATHRSPFDHAIRLTGAKLIVIGTQDKITSEELKSAINKNTVAMAYVHDTHLPPVTLPFEQIVEICHNNDIRVVVDAAAELPPHTNLQYFLKAGADLVVFSGGKGIQGPQSAGLILGCKDLIECCVLNSAPNADTIGRPMKAGKEEIAGLVTAVELYVKRDHEKMLKKWEDIVSFIMKSISDFPGVKARRVFPMGKFRPIPVVSINFDNSITKHTVSGVIKKLKDGEPPIFISNPESLPVPTFTSTCAVSPYDKENSIIIKPQSLKEGDEKIIVRRLREILSG